MEAITKIAIFKSKAKIIIKLLATLGCSLYFIAYMKAGSLEAGWNLLDGVDLIIHEAGHIVFMPFGHFMNILGGSLLQIIIPILFIVYFFIRKQHFSASILFFWLGQNVINISYYLGDAIVQQLSLLGGDAVIHDWNYILSHVGLIKYTDTISHVLLYTGRSVILAAIVLCLYSIFREYKQQDQ